MNYGRSLISRPAPAHTSPAASPQRSSRPRDDDSPFDDGSHLSPISSNSLNRLSHETPVYTQHVPSPLHTPTHRGRRMSITSLAAANDKLKGALEFEEMETLKLEGALREYKSKFNDALTVQSQLEEDLLHRDRQLDALRKELKDSRRAKNELESSMSQELMNYINEKQQWLDKEASYEARISSLGARAKTQPQLSISSALSSSALSTASSAYSAPLPSPTPSLAPSLSSTVSAASSNATIDASSDKHAHIKAVESRASESKTIDRLRNELDMLHQQMELVSREYTLRFDTVKKDMEQTRSVNSRLMEENEAFQVLLAEKTITGGFSLADELASDEDTSVVEGQVLSDELGSLEDSLEDVHKDCRAREAELQFESRAQSNYNRALRLSLERLVQRLLEFREFEKIVEVNDRVPQRSISTFHDRVVSSISRSSSPSDSLIVPKRRSSASPMKEYAGSSASSLGAPVRVPLRSRLKPSATWSSMLFANNPQLTIPQGSSDGQRSPSLGIDDSFSSASSAASLSDSGSDVSRTGSESSRLDDTLRGLEDKRSTAATRNQRNLRPLRLSSPHASEVNLAHPSPATSSATSTWSFNLL